MNQARMHVGVDVGKDSLDICYPDGTKEHVKNTRRCRTKLIKKAKAIGAIVSFEATGPYEEHLEEGVMDLPSPSTIANLYGG